MKSEQVLELIAEGPDLITEFMGLELSKGVQHDSRVYYKIPYYHDSLIACKDQFMHSKSWDWLMPVVQKIYLIRTVEIEMSLGCLKIDCLLHGGFFGSDYCVPEKTGIECWYVSVLEFIKWYLLSVGAINSKTSADTSL